MNWCVLGNSGSGKSTLAQRLGPVVLDLDTVAWQEGDPPMLRREDEAIRLVDDFVRTHPQWVVEGCYANLLPGSSTGEAGLVYLDFEVSTCLERAKARAWEPHKFSSFDEQQQALATLLDWIEQYPEREGPMGRVAHEQLFQHWQGPKWRIREARSFNAFLEENP